MKQKQQNLDTSPACVSYKYTCLILTVTFMNWHISLKQFKLWQFRLRLQSVGHTATLPVYLFFKMFSPREHFLFSCYLTNPVTLIPNSTNYILYKYCIGCTLRWHPRTDSLNYQRPDQNWGVYRSISLYLKKGASILRRLYSRNSFPNPSQGVCFFK